MSQIEPFFDDFAMYISTGNASNLLPYLSEGSNPDFLKIYRNGAIKAGIDALTSNFPTLKQKLGDEAFRDVCRNYILKNWPTEGRLSKYGSAFSDQIKQSIDVDALENSDVAALDFAWLTSLLAADDTKLTSDSIRAILSDNDVEQLSQLQLSSSTKLVYLNTDSLSDWIEMKFQSETRLDDQTSRTILFWRQGNSVHYRALNNFEFKFIETLFESGSIFNAAQVALNAEPNEDLSALFAALLSSSILTRGPIQPAIHSTIDFPIPSKDT